MKHLRATFAVALAAWAYHPVSFAEDQAEASSIQESGSAQDDSIELLRNRGDSKDRGERGNRGDRGNRGGGNHGPGHGGGWDGGHGPGHGPGHNPGHGGGGNHGPGHGGGGGWDGGHHGGECWNGRSYPYCDGPGYGNPWQPYPPRPPYVDLCDGSYFGSYNGRSASLNLMDINGYRVRGSLRIRGDRYYVTGVCEQNGRSASFALRVNGSELVIRGQIQQDWNGSISLWGRQDRTGAPIRMSR